MKNLALLFMVLLAAGCANTTTISVPIIRLHEEKPIMHEASPLIQTALQAIQMPPRAKVYRLGHGVAPSGTRLLYFEKPIFTAPCDGTFIFVDHDPELDWAHSAWVIFIPNRTGAKATIVNGENNSILPSHRLEGSSGEEFDSLWQELTIKQSPNPSAHGTR
jgi:hypothetical protein